MLVAMKNVTQLKGNKLVAGFRTAEICQLLNIASKNVPINSI
jgi:hypothetical protein